MASDETAASVDETLAEEFQSLFDSYRRIGMPLERYLGFVLAPSAAFFLLTLAAAVLVDLPLMIRVPIPLLGALAFATAAFYPRIVVSNRRTQLNNRFHLLVTHMTVLATTNIDRMQVFRTLADEEEYGELAEEMHRIVQLVDSWNQSLDDACRRRAKEVPSEALSDFLDRLAYTIGAGQSLEDYLVTEQQQIIENYATVYESSLDSVEVMKDLYLSMILSMTFALVFAIVLPVLTGTDPTMTVGAVIVMYIFVQSGFFLAIRSVAPYDPVWYHPPDRTPAVDARITTSLIVGVSLTVLLLFISIGGILGVSPVGLGTLVPLFGNPLPFPLYAAIPLTPLAIPGFVIRREEEAIKARDDEFPSFVRALGATEGAKQSTTSQVLLTLREKDFGDLTRKVDDLYKRLNMRIETVDAWRWFTADCRSYLIQTFSEMYLMGREMGGSPKQLGELIAENMNEVQQLRQQRRQVTVTLIGLLYGITAASTFAFYIGLQVVNILSSLTLNLSSSGQFDAGNLINTSVYNIPLLEFLLIVLIMFSAVLSALMIRTIDGGHKMNAYIHFVALSWIAALISIVTKSLVDVFLAV